MFPFGLEQKDLIVFVAGAAVAIIVAYIFYRMGLRGKRLSYSVLAKSLIFKSRDYPGDLKITFAGQEIESLARFTIYVWNSGKEPITRTDLETSSRLRWNIDPELKVLQSSIVFQTRDANAAALDRHYIDFDYLNAGDGFVIDIFVDTKPKGRLLQKALARFASLSGEVVGVTDPPTQKDYDVSSGSGLALTLMLVSGFFLWIFGAFEIVLLQALWSEPTAGRIVGGIIVTVLTSLVAFGFFFSIAMLFGGKIPLKLLLKDDQPQGKLAKLKAFLR